MDCNLQAGNICSARIIWIITPGNHLALDIPQSGHNVLNIASFIYFKNFIIRPGVNGSSQHSNGVLNI
jgi:hypothetical protein